jgi:undecaprenyl diphosphate synthase
MHDVEQPASATASQVVSADAPAKASNSSLRHVLVVGGTLQEWAEMSDDEWSRRVGELGSLCAEVGVPWLTLRAYEEGVADDRGALARWRHSVDGCDIVVDPCGDGRERFADAMQRLDPADEVNEATVAAVLYEPADCEPDLVVVLGPPTQLPPSLVWELAYAELVFLPVGWHQLGAGDLAHAIADFSNRRRRFGGLDDDE